MSDYTDLQKAAEYAAQDTIKFADEAEEMRALQQFHEEVDPETVLALIAENQRLKTLRSVTERDLAQELEVWRNGPSCWSCGDTGDVHDIVGEWRGQCDCNAAKLIDVTGERDQLKAENEALRRERDARHPFKPFHEPAIGFTGCVICGVYTDHGGLPCPKTRAAAIALSMENQRLTPVEPLRVPHPLDAALGQGEQS